MKIAGIDEAGKGPLIGIMVICGAMTDEENIEKLRPLGVKDSKLLSPSRREELAEILPGYITYNLQILSPKQVDEAVFSTETNLNWLEADNTAQIINTLKPDKVIVDCPSPNIQNYKDYLVKKVVTHTEIIAEHKADVNYLIVGAASILAKVKRDAEITKLKKEIGIDFGSGYPSDPKTKKFLQENWNRYPEIFRQSWISYRRLKEATDD